MKRSQWLIGLCTLLFASALFASPVDKLNQYLSNFHSLTANFTQTIYGDRQQKLQSSSGKIKILRPGKFSWDTIQPMKQLIISNGKIFWLYEPDLEQVTVKTLSTNLADIPLMILTNKQGDLQKDFIVKPLPNNTYQLTPKTDGDGFKQITIAFRNGIIRSLTLLNALDRVTKINFSRVKLNAPLTAKQFDFKPPRGVDVVKQ